MGFHNNNFDKNLAYDFEMFDNLAEQKKTAKIIKLKRKKVNVERFRLKMMLFVALIFVCLLVASISSILIYGCSKNSEITSKISEMSKTLNEEISRNTYLKNKKESLAFSAINESNQKNKSKKIEYILNSPTDKAEIY